MGREKDEHLVREENARERARQDGNVCGCFEPLLTAEERTAGLCSRCQHNLEKD